MQDYSEIDRNKEIKELLTQRNSLKIELEKIVFDIAECAKEIEIYENIKLKQSKKESTLQN